MQKAQGALWRIEYQTDLTRVDAPSIPLGFMLESTWENGASWLGLLFRQKLTVAELDLVNLETWPNLKDDLEKFMVGLFDKAWGSEDELGSLAVSKLYPSYSALRLVPREFAIDLGDYHKSESYQQLYAQLWTFEDELQPIAVAPVISLKKKTARPFVFPEPIELLSKAA